MKIVFVSKECPPSPRSSGIGAYVWETGRALAQQGHQVTIVAAADVDEVSLSTPLPNLTVHRLHDDEQHTGDRNIVARTLRGPIAEGMAYRRRVAACLDTLVDQNRADIVEFPGFRGESYVWLNGMRRLPMVVRMHGFTAGLDTGWKKRLSASGRCLHTWETREVRVADVITAVSENQAAAVRARFGADRLRVVHNSIDTAQWQRLAASAGNELDAGDILYAGGLAAKKGIFVLLNAAAYLKKQGWRGRLVLAGRPHRDWERHVRLLSMTGRSLPPWLLLLGACPRERLAGLYRDAGVCCFPSLQDPFPYTCMEAMTCGGVVVGSAGTGMDEMLNEECGYLPPHGDATALAAALQAALQLSGADRLRMGHAAARRVVQNFDHAAILPRLLQTYGEAIALFQRRGAR